MPELVIALTFVALGTSLPSWSPPSPRWSRATVLSLGNVIGANVFNLVLVSGVSVTLAPFSILAKLHHRRHERLAGDGYPVMFAVMLLLTVPASDWASRRLQALHCCASMPPFCAVQSQHLIWYINVNIQAAARFCAAFYVGRFGMAAAIGLRHQHPHRALGRHLRFAGCQPQQLLLFPPLAVNGRRCTRPYSAENYFIIFEYGASADAPGIPFHGKSLNELPSVKT